MGSSPFARHYSGSRGFFPFLRLLRCFSSPACRSGPIDSGRNTRALPRVGFPIRRSRDQRSVSTSPGLFAAAHVLLRLLAPRHPPCALRLLIMKNTVVAAMEFSRCTRVESPAGARLRPDASRPSAGLSKLNSVGRRGRRSSRRARSSDGRRPSTSRATYRSNRSGIPRKEVIQPQLPLRLPCYDFTPITNPTFDGSLPCGLGHRLRVLPAFVV